jgi:hypothetical protein
MVARAHVVLSDPALAFRIYVRDDFCHGQLAAEADPFIRFVFPTGSSVIPQLSGLREKKPQ